jgi:multidrug efflux pump
MTPRFFIDRPIFATVLSVLITLAGSLAIFKLPISQYPQVVPPTIQIDCNYPGANARIVADTVALPIEQQVNGVEDMLYMASQCTSDGSYTLTVTFEIGTDLNMSQIRVLNRVALAYPQLPDVVTATGVTTRKRSAEILMTLALSSPGNRYDQLYLSNYAVIRLREELSRLPGVSDVLIFGQRDYSMRVWVDPDKLATRNLSAGDVVSAIQQQNKPLVAGQLGQPPTGDGQPFQIPLTGIGRLMTVEEYEQVIVKVGPNGQKVLVKDVARVDLGAKAEDVSNTFDNKPTVGLAVFLLADANALEAHDRIVAKMDEMAKDFPAGIIYEIGYDTTPFIRESIHEVFNSLWESIALVALVVLVFLQSWRAAIIPLAAVPVAIVGTFAAMAMLGYTINNLTLFGLVLAVGIVVDDAIVVVEAVQHQLEKGFAPREATIRAMEDVAGPVMAVGVVLSAVFIPCAFLSGIVGQFFRQFAVTIAVSTMISTFNSLTLSPALCAILLKRTGQGSGQRPFPKLVCPLIGAALGYALYIYFFGALKTLLIAPAWCAETLALLCSWINEEINPNYSWITLVVSLGVTGLAGWLLARLPSLSRTTRLVWLGAVLGLGLLTWAESAPALLNVAHSFRGAAKLIPELSDHVQEWKAKLGSESVWIAPALLMVMSALVGGFLVNPFLERFFDWFNGVFARGGKYYVRMVSSTLRLPFLILSVYGLFVLLGAIGYGYLPTGFIPQQDKGYLIASVQLPDAAATDRTRDKIEQITKTILDYQVLVDARRGEEGAEEVTERLRRDGKPARPEDKKDVVEPGQWVRRIHPVRHANCVAGNSFVLSAYGSNFGSMFIILDDFANRQDARLYADEVRTKLSAELDMAIPEASVAIFGAPAVSGLGRAGGFRFMIEDRGDVGPEALREQTDNFIAKSRQLSQVTGLFTVYKTNSPQIFVDIDRVACLSKGVAIADVNTALQACMGAQYVNDFNRFGRTWQVNVQADHTFRDELEDIVKLKVRNTSGTMVPLAAVVKVKETFSPLVISRYNMYSAAAVNGNVTPGVSTGDARIALDQLADRELPTTMSAEWTELSFIEQLAGKSELRIFGIFKFRGDTTVLVFGLSVAFVFLVLAALYESFAFPLAVILVVPVCVVCSLAAVWITDPGTAQETLKKWNENSMIPGWFKPERFELSAEDLASLKRVPPPVLAKLAPLLNRQLTREEFQKELSTLLSAEEKPPFQDLIVKQALKPSPWAAAVANWIDIHPIRNANRLVAEAGVRKGDVNIFTQVGFVVLIGLACKNAILIVEFARVSRNKGADVRSAVLEACKLRFRPILMTSVAFILGVVPLVVATGAGSEMRQALGVAVIGGMTGVTLFGIFLTPIFFTLVDRLSSTSLFKNKYLLAVNQATLSVLSFRFVRPLAGVVFSAGTGLRKMTKRRFGA